MGLWGGVEAKVEGLKLLKAGFLGTRVKVKIRVRVILLFTGNPVRVRVNNYKIIPGTSFFRF